MIDLQIPASEHALIKDQSLGNKIGLREFDVGIAVVSLERCLVCDNAWKRWRRKCRWLLTLWDDR